METQDKEVKAQQQIAQEYAQMRAMTLEHCKVAIEQVLREHGCTLVAVPQIAQDGRIVATVQVVLNNGS